MLKIIKGKLSRNTETFGKMDPYVKVLTLNGQEYKSQVHSKGGDNPVWNESLDIPNVSA